MIHDMRTCCALLLVLAPVLGAAQESTPAEAPATTADAALPEFTAEGDPIGWHVVKAGETLQQITQRYLGDAQLWRLNWRLNPDMDDPHRLVPGQRIRVILSHQVPTAEITELSRKVEERPFPDPWVAAELGNQLKARDGVRTWENSSAKLGFEDGSDLVISELSVVFLRNVGTRLEGVERKSLEIVEGEADVEAAPIADAASDIEIVMGDATASSRSIEGGSAQTRARRTPEGGAQVMVYAGSGEVASAGKSVTVPPGMGTAVEAGKAPGEPERLLPPPQPVLPSRDAALAHANPEFRWVAVPGADSYTLEICRDADCGALVSRVRGRTRPDWAADGLPLGQLYWRVRAVSPTGLDGFPSEASPFKVRSLWRKGDDVPEPAG